ncbi:MAG: ABC transporter permease [Phycisphaeraceae bacterium]|nr:ABC transporter permease [Phycisphaeraceae bacterium]
MPVAAFQPVFLPTDVLIWLVMVAAAVSAAFASRREYWRNAWRQVAANGAAVASLGILLLFLAVALLDSIHYRQTDPQGAVSTLSVLDRICEPLLDSKEESYSAPFAIRGFSERSRITEEGLVRNRPRLEHAGEHLEAESNHLADALGRSLLAIGLGGLVGAGVGLASVLLWKRRTGRAPSRSRQRGTVLFFVVVAAVAALLIATAGRYHILGTDKVGNSTLVACLKSIRTALVIGILTTMMVTPIAVGLGVLAGFLRGWVDDAVQYLYTTFSSIPSILLIAAAMMIVQTQLLIGEVEQTADLQLLGLCLVLALTSWAGLCRLIRAEALKLREIEYVQAARSLGLGKAKIMVRHLVPNVLHLVLIDMVLKFSALVLAEVVLAYIGIGVHPSTESFGQIIKQAQEELARSPVIWWNLAASFAFMLALVVPANLLADAVRDALDPKLRVQRN